MPLIAGESAMSEPRRMKVKICLVGEHAVGKTSLIKRYVLNEYDDRYIVTLGAKVSKKEMLLTPKSGEPVQMDMTIWDIMGSKGFRELLREAYFRLASSRRDRPRDPVPLHGNLPERPESWWRDHRAWPERGTKSWVHVSLHLIRC